MSNTELHDMTAVELSSRFKCKQLSPVEVTKAALARIERLNNHFDAYCFIDREGALDSACASERRWASGIPLSAIDGVPASIKDLCLTKGWPTLRGSLTVDPAGPWIEDAPCTTRLREAGAVLLGKTTTPERGWKGVTDNPRGEVARNPWDISKTAGGSSGGAAVAAALGMGALHIGTDGGGSIRIPAAFCGIVGFKPSFGRVPAYPPSPFGDVAHIGPITRSVTDAALMLNVISQPDFRDCSALPYDPRDYCDGIDNGVSGLTVAWSPDLGFVSVDPEVEEIVAKAVAILGSESWQIENAELTLDDPIDIFHKHWYTGAAATLSNIPRDRQIDIDPGLVEIAREGGQYDHMDYIAATHDRAKFCQRVAQFFKKTDVLLTPAMPIAAFEAGREVPFGSGLKRWTGWTGFTYPFNLTQQPAVVVPCGYTSSG
jgi:aspartyl-tRNA(Asn)/glutamyl-tRNA(Gln) amidotransferase subunit A